MFNEKNLSKEFKETMNEAKEMDKYLKEDNKE